MKLDLAAFKLLHHALNASVNMGMIRSIAGDKLQNDSGKRIGGKFRVRDLHR